MAGKTPTCLAILCAILTGCAGPFIPSSRRAMCESPGVLPAQSASAALCGSRVIGWDQQGYSAFAKCKWGIDGKTEVGISGSYESSHWIPEFYDPDAPQATIGTGRVESVGLLLKHASDRTRGIYAQQAELTFGFRDYTNHIAITHLSAVGYENKYLVPYFNGSVQFKMPITLKETVTTDHSKPAFAVTEILGIKVPLNRVRKFLPNIYAETGIERQTFTGYLLSYLGIIAVDATVIPYTTYVSIFQRELRCRFSFRPCGLSRDGGSLAV